MSAQQFAELREHLVATALEVVWRQWHTVGAAAGVTKPATSLVDPEALVLMTLALLDDEPRLADILHDWMRLNSRSISTQRIGNLSEELPTSTQRALGMLASQVVSIAKDARWRAVATHYLADGTMPPMKSSPKSRAVEHAFDLAPALLLKLRLGLGVGVKADALGFLLGTGGAWASIPVIAAAIGYTSAGIRRAVDDLADAHFVAALSGLDSLLDDGGQAVYVASHDEWRALLRIEGPFPPWRSWAERFRFVASFLDWEAGLQGRAPGEYALAVEARRLFESQRAAFVRDRAVMLRNPDSVENWIPYLRDATLQLNDWMMANV